MSLTTRRDGSTRLSPASPESSDSLVTVPVPSKPTVQDLRIDVGAQNWQCSGAGRGSIEVAFVEALGERWVLMRVAGDPDGRILVYDHFEWECFVDGAQKGEFDDAV
jgi:hypothetical protein